MPARGVLTRKPTEASSMFALTVTAGPDFLSQGIAPEVLLRLADPFPEHDLDWRVQQSGVRDGRPWARILCYVTARAIQERLDDVVGAANWRVEYAAGPVSGVMCGLSILVQGRGWLTKWDGAGEAEPG